MPRRVTLYGYHVGQHPTRGDVRRVLRLLMDSVVGRLRAKRERRGVTLRDLADQIGVHFTTLQQYETGKTIPSLRALERWCAALDCALDVRDAALMDARHAAAMETLARVIPVLSGPMLDAAVAAVQALAAADVKKESTTL